MERYWTWKGKYIGVRQRDYLAACDGTILVKFYGRGIYRPEGEYIGELGKNDRLIRRAVKKGMRRPGFSRGVRGTVNEPLRDCLPYPDMEGFEEFDPEGKWG